MKTKQLLFIGIVFLTSGILLKATTDSHPWPLLILLLGVACKAAYIVVKIIAKEYKPGWEILFLLTGLTLFLGSMILAKHGIIENPSPYKVVGISLKVIFIILFIRETHKKQSLKQ